MGHLVFMKIYPVPYFHWKGKPVFRRGIFARGVMILLCSAFGLSLWVPETLPHQWAVVLFLTNLMASFCGILTIYWRYRTRRIFGRATVSTATVLLLGYFWLLCAIIYCPLRPPKRLLKAKPAQSS